MSDVRLEDIRIPRVDVPWSHLVGAQNHRSATVADLIEVLKEQGAWEVGEEEFEGPYGSGRYLVFPLPVEPEEET